MRKLKTQLPGEMTCRHCRGNQAPAPILCNDCPEPGLFSFIFLAIVGCAPSQLWDWEMTWTARSTCSISDACTCSDPASPPSSELTSCGQRASGARACAWASLTPASAQTTRMSRISGSHPPASIMAQCHSHDSHVSDTKAQRARSRSLCQTIPQDRITVRALQPSQYIIHFGTAGS